MNIDADQLLENALRDGIRESVKQRFTQYKNPLDDLITAAIARHSDSFRTMLDDSLKSCLGDAEFRESIADAVRHSLAKTLIQRFGGELEKQVNVLKSNPTTRARITVAIEEIVKSQSAATA